MGCVQPQRLSEEAPKDDFTHGTYTGYSRRGCRCEKCRRYNTENGKAYRQRRRNQEREIQHGTANAYVMDGCRCELCRRWRKEQSRQEDRSEQRQRYYERHQETIKAKTKRYYETNKPMVLEKQAEYARKNRERFRERNNERARLWKQTPQGRYRNRKDQAARRRMPFTDEASEYGQAILNDPCAYCGGRDRIVMDHLSNAECRTKGRTDWWDLTAACLSCNSSKGNRPLVRFLISLSEMR